MSHRFITGGLVTSSLAIALAAGALPARADVVTAVWNHNTSFSYEITHMPDLDQRRMAAAGVFGLPNNGSMYCVPTSTMNMMMYAANHGFPNVVPGPNNWQSNEHYNSATLAIFLIGQMMGTHPEDGTGGFGWRDGATDWLNQNAEGSKFTVELKYFTGALGPNLNSLAQAGINGHLVSFGYGRYTHIGTHEGLPYYERTGGHIVTMAKAFRNGSEQKIWIRDPADDNVNLTTQSTFTNLLWNVEGKAVYVKTDNGPALRLFSALGYEPPPATARFIDGALLIRPKAGYSFTTTGGLIKLAHLKPFKFLGTNAAPSEYTIGAPGAFVHGTINASGTEAFTIGQIPGAPNRIFAVDLLTEQTQALADLPNASHLALSPKGNLYILTPNQLHCIDLMDPDKPLASTELPLSGATASAMTFDTFHDEIVVFSASNNTLLLYRDLMLPPTIMTVPESILLEGKAALAVCPVTGMYWFGSEGSNTLHGWGFDDSGTPFFEQATPFVRGFPHSFDFDDDGHLYVSDGSSLVHMHKTAFAGWQPVMDSLFAGLNVGSVFKMTKSETNFDPLLHSGPGYFNIDPDELEFGEVVFDCYPDQDGNGVVGVADLLLLLGAWGECSDGPCPADLTGNRSVGVPDLLVLLGAWGPCP